MGKSHNHRNTNYSDDEAEKLAIIIEKLEYTMPPAVRDRLRPGIPALIRSLSGKPATSQPPPPATGPYIP